MSEELMSGSDIRGTESTGLNLETAWNVGKALADWLPSEGGVVIVANQATVHLAQAVMEGLRLQGRDVVNGGVGDKEKAISYIQSAHLAGGVVIGVDESNSTQVIELYQAEGQPIVADTGLNEIKDLVNAGNFVPAAAKGNITSIA